jgi:4-amino-4-deoxy-L-arabinose transferase-like glycosyltransferase
MPFVPWRALEPNSARRFCLIAATVIIAIFSLASAKLIPYILPALAPLAVVMADGLLVFANHDSASGADSRRLAFGALMIVMLGATVLGVALCADRFASANPMMVRPVLYLAGGAIMIGGILALALFRGRRLFFGLGTIAVASAVTMLIASYGRIMAEPSRSYARLARTIATRAPAARLICYPRYIQSLPFYCRRRVILVGAKTELAFGANHAPDATEFFFTRLTDLLRLWDEPQPSVVIVDRGAFASLAPRLGAYSVIASDAKKIVVIRAQPDSHGATRAHE